MRLVVIALLIALPLAWFAMSKWLESYAYRITLTPLYFLAAGALAVLIALATISLRTVKRQGPTGKKFTNGMSK